MPHLKKVKKLHEICILAFNEFCLDYIDRVLPKDQNRAIIEQRRHTFLSNVNPIINESLLHYIDENIILGEFEKLMSLTIYRNVCMKTFNPRFKLPNMIGFYETYLTGLNKLVVLNLTKVCTDEVLKIVGENCPLLEIIYIISKTESLSKKNRRDLNALKLKYFVSDEGLSQLHNCKYLKKIYMDKIIRSSCGGRKITHKGLISLLYFLPNVQYISYEDMGRVLEEWFSEPGGIRPLHLNHIHDNHVTPHHISILSSLCPSVRTLCLAVPTVAEDPDVPSQCLERLAESTVAIENLVLKCFPFDEALSTYLCIKGKFLTSLSLEHNSSITTGSLTVIGEKCKLLQNLAVKLLYPSHSDYEIMQLKTAKYFTKLTTLKVFGVNWKPDVLFDLCVYDAQNLKSLILYNKYFNEPLDVLFETLISKNPLPNLETLSLLDGFRLKPDTLIRFVLECNNLKELTMNNDSECIAYVDELTRNRNLDLTIKTDMVGSYGYCLCQH